MATAAAFYRQERKELGTMKKALLVMMLAGCVTLFAETHVSIGIGIGGYGPAYGPVYAPAPPPPPPEYGVPACPGEGYVWVDGYWGNVSGRFVWRPGYWRAPVYGYRGERGYGWSDRGYDRHERREHERYERERDWERRNRYYERRDERGWR